MGGVEGLYRAAAAVLLLALMGPAACPGRHKLEAALVRAYQTIRSSTRSAPRSASPIIDTRAVASVAVSPRLTLFPTSARRNHPGA